ncbi:uncharacterized protein [Linepithema humile]|uniref:uncharacterized protein n=1 Tax=Linepithema humile TaxID=83485 RepID=UPI0006236F8C|nr:PREDICTED: uncharacterized protein LOC105673957 [Linepithema humile]
MRKAIAVLALIAFACDISRDVLVHGKPARKPEAAGRNDGYEYQTELHGQFDDVEMSRRIAEDRERSGEPVGKWRSNGEALEPKWRDGDSVPLLPFSHYRSYSRDAVDDVEDFPATSRRPLKHRYSPNRPNRPRENPGGQAAAADDYDYEAAAYLRSRDYGNPDENYARRRRRPSKTPREETIESAASSDGMRDRDRASDTLNDEVTSRYREAFQARPDEYEHEFNDEEYLRPRPRKRRPPQNYEFALANEASDEENEEPRDPAKLASQRQSEDPPTTTQSSDDGERKNALELKSLLKMQQQEGLSLLEILQRKNLTLSDLLKGKADVINALKSRMADESDEYVEEMSRVMSNSLMKLAATATLPWRPAQQTSTAPGSTTARTVATSSGPDNSIFKTTAVLRNTSESYDEISANDAANVKDEPKNVERRTQSARDFPRLRATTPAIVTTVTITTPASPPDAMSSVEYLSNDDGNAESTGDRATKLGALDEDEIMEFSDFTDFTKKGKSPTASSWSEEPPGETVGPRDTESTLSIERILNPTVRVELTKDRENAEGANGKVIRNGDRSVPTGEPSAEDYNGFVEAEYQNDAPPVDHPADDAGRDAMAADSRASESHASSADDRKEMPREKNHSSEYHRVEQSAREKPRSREEHASSSSSRRYEDVVSEIEPEARAEIFELFASGSAGRRLERLLKSRNMSVEELIALRQRGSSRVHLTEVSRLKASRNPPILEASNTNKGEVPFPKDSHEHFGARIKALEKDSAKQEVERPTNQFRDIMSYLHNPFLDKDEANISRLLDLAERDRDASIGTASSENKYRPENSDRTIVNLLTPFGAFAKDLQQQFETEEEMKSEESKASLPTGDDNTSTMLIGERKTVPPEDRSSELRAGYVEEIAREAPTTIEIRTIGDETASRADAEDERKALSRMRPSIIASGAILGVTVVVFLAIFIVCRIRQKQRYTYRNTFSRAVFQGPVMAARKLSNSSSLSTVMVNVVATSTAKRPERMETQEVAEEFDGKCDMDNDSLDANDSWETIPDYAK